MSTSELVPVVDAFRVPMSGTEDVSGLVALVKRGHLRADDVVAVTGKTAGWGPGYDASRVEADHAVRRFLTEHGTRNSQQIEQLPMAFSAGVGTILTPHLVVYTRTESASTHDDGATRLTLGTVRSEVILPEWVGTTRAVEANADAVRAGAADAGIPVEDVEFVVGKSYYPTQDMMRSARHAGRRVSDFDDETMFRLGGGSAALGVAVATEGMPMPRDEDIGRNPDMWSGRLAVSTNPWEDIGGPGPQSQLMIFGNRQGTGGRLSVGHSSFRDMLDVAAVPRALRRAGMAVGEGPLTAAQSERVVAAYLKFDSPAQGLLRGRRLVTEDPAYDSTLRTAIAGAFAAMLQDNMIWISAGATQQGPAGGGTFAVVVDVD